MTSKRLQLIAIVMAVIAVIVSAIAVVVVEKRNEPDPVAAPAEAVRSEQAVAADAAIADPQPPEEPPDRGVCATTACTGANDCPAHDCECDAGRIVHTRSCVNGCCSNKADACASSCDR